MLPWNSYKFLPISSKDLKVGHFKAKGINIGDIKFQLSVIFFFWDIVLLMNLTFGGSEMGVVRFLGVASLEFEEFVSAYNIKKCWASCFQWH